MTTTQNPSTPTKDPRVRIVGHGRQNWRTEVADSDGEWAVTGAPYATRAEAFANVDTAIAVNF